MAVGLDAAEELFESIPESFFESLNPRLFV
jgi:hypothetical protein